jgi:hypothetical protein
MAFHYPKLYLKKLINGTYQLHAQVKLRRGYDLVSVSHQQNPGDQASENSRTIVFLISRAPGRHHEAPVELAVPISIQERVEGNEVEVLVNLQNQEKDQLNGEYATNLNTSREKLNNLLEIKEKRVGNRSFSFARQNSRSLKKKPVSKGINSYSNEEDWS